MAKQRLLFGKEGPARYMSHLDLMRTFQRAFFRAGIPIWHTEGFHPHAFVSVALPLSLGYESVYELLDFQATAEMEPDWMASRLAGALPAGIGVFACYAPQRPFKEIADACWEITLCYDQGAPGDGPGKIGALLDRSGLWVTKRTKATKKKAAGVTQVDIRPMIRRVDCEPRGTDLVVQGTFSAQEPALNPALWMDAVVGAYPELTPDFVRYRRVLLLDGEGTPFL